MKTAEKIKTLRLSLGMTQEELAEKCDVQKSVVSKYERGAVINIKRDTLSKLATALGVMPIDLMDDTEKRELDGGVPTQQEIAFLNMFRRLDDSGKELVLAFLNREESRNA
jgi:transcriptional regulator with XRE-family HTH domain